MQPTNKDLRATNPSINQTTATPEPAQASILQLAARTVGPALVNYTAGALITTGAALLLTGVGALPGIILMGVGAAAFVTNTALLTCHLPAEFETVDYLLYSCRCLVWGLYFILTLPTLILLQVSMGCIGRWLLKDESSKGSQHHFSSDISWLLLPEPRDKLPDQTAFSGLEC